VLYLSHDCVGKIADFRYCGILQNRKNDEVSYEKMLKLKKDLNKAM